MYWDWRLDEMKNADLARLAIMLDALNCAAREKLTPETTRRVAEGIKAGRDLLGPHLMKLKVAPNPSDTAPP
jgi:molybdenum cofactor biosynthesis enzyme MoaA